MTVDDAVELAAGKYSKELEKHYTKLFEKITGIGACLFMMQLTLF